MPGAGAQPTNTYDAYDAGTANMTGGSNREDLSDIIYDISPTETPFLTMAGRGTAMNAKHEWLVDALTTAASNRQIEGDDYTGDTRAAPTRLFNMTQISAKALTVSGTQEVVDKAGRKSEIAYQLMRQAKEIKRDIERHITGYMTTGDATAIGGGTAIGDSYPITLGTNAVARVAGSLGTWITTNAQLGSGTHGYTNPTFGSFFNAGTTQRALLESTLKAGIKAAWEQGGNPGTIIVDGFNKQVISSFTGGTTKFDNTADKRLITAIDVYVSDFGDHTVYPSRFAIAPGASGGTTAYILDMNYWSVDYLRPFQQVELATTGDSAKRLLLTEWTLTSKNQLASAAVFNLTFA